MTGSLPARGQLRRGACARAFARRRWPNDAASMRPAWWQLLPTLVVVLVATGPFGTGSAGAQPLPLHRGIASSPGRAASSSSQPPSVGLAPAVTPAPLQAPPSFGWTQLFPALYPRARLGATITFDTRDGYALLFGGTGGDYQVKGIEHARCLNDTWAFSNGAWRNLSVAGPPPSCTFDMAYDPVDGYVVAYLVSGDPGSPHPYINQTWTYGDGLWSRVNGSGPNLTFGTGMAFDPQLDAVLLYGAAVSAGGYFLPYTWEFTGGQWVALAGTDPPIPGGPSFNDKMTLDSFDGYPLLMSSTQRGTGAGAFANGTWAFVNGSWRLVTELPVSGFDGEGGLAFDPVCNCSIWFGGVSSAGRMNSTWAYSEGVWWNLSTVGPIGRLAPAMGFDQADGVVVLFGGDGVQVTNDLNASLLNDTWVYEPHAMGLAVKVVAEPHAICPLFASGCGAPQATTVAISLRAAAVTGQETWGTDLGNGTTEYGPFHGIYDPSIMALGFGNVTFATNLSSGTDCGRADNGEVQCRAAPVREQVGSDLLALDWHWKATGPVNSMEVGDWWNLSITMVAGGPPYGTVPLLSCITEVCLSSGSRSVNGLFSSLVFTGWAAEAGESASFPYSAITVLGSPHTDQAPTPQLPPPPSPIGSGPSPVVNPVSAGPAPQPVLALPGAAAAPLSLYALAAGLIAAGFARSTISYSPSRVAIAVRLTRAAGDGPSARSPGPRTRRPSGGHRVIGSRWF